MLDLTALSDAELLARAAALLETDPEHDRPDSWALVVALHNRGSQDVFDQAIAWCASTDPALQRLGTNVLGQLAWSAGYPFAAVSTPILERLLTDPDDSVVSCALVALGHLGTGHNDRICAMASHASDQVRYSVVWCLGLRDEPIARATLITLSRDVDVEVRDWATFGLGCSDIDSPEIRQALVDRLHDTDAETREEAMLGLARRGDTRADAAVAAAMNDADPSALVLEAAEAIAGRRQPGNDRSS